MCRSFGDRIAKRFLGIAHGNRNGNCQAALAGAPERAIGDDLRGHLHIRVRKNDDVVLRSSLALCTLPVRSGTRVNIARYRSGTNETYRADFGMVVSLAGFTSGAVAFASGKPIFLVDIGDLIAMQEGRDVLASAFITLKT